MTDLTSPTTLDDTAAATVRSYDNLFVFVCQGQVDGPTEQWCIDNAQRQLAEALGSVPSEFRGHFDCRVASGWRWASWALILK